MDKNEILEALQDRDNRVCQVYVKYIGDKLTVYTIKNLFRFNGDSFAIEDRDGTEVIIPYAAVQRIIKKRVDTNARR